MIEEVGKKCCGCSACVNICPQNSIVMQENSEGFLYPVVRKDSCINCELCENVCPILHPQRIEKPSYHEAWGGTCKNEDILYNSSSGGLFTLLAQEILAQGGCVFGAAFSNDFEKVTHIMVTKPEDLGRLRGSKYLQSEMNTCYRQVKQELLSGRKVLFSGTPCQIAGLKGYLGKAYDGLICVDVICHGTPSSKVWKTYLNHLERQLGGGVSSVSFRNKKQGWHKFGLYLKNADKVYYRDLYKDPYLRMFLNNTCLREACYQCVMKKQGSVSDITLGDFWGVENVAPKLYNNRGVSLVLLHSEKGREVLYKVRPMLTGGQIDYDAAIKRNSAYRHSVRRPKGRDTFFDDFGNFNWEKMEKRYGRDNLKNSFKRRLSKSWIGRLKSRLLTR